MTTSQTVRKVGRWIFNPEAIAFLTYNALAGTLVLLIEVAWTGIMTGEQWLWVRAIYIPIKFAGYKFAAKLTDSIRESLPENLPLRAKVAGAIGIVTYQLPIYIPTTLGVGFALGTSAYQIAYSWAIYLAYALPTAWTYGDTLDWARRFFTRRSEKIN